ncbi:hypothetical protein AWB82_07081 [Caballeronia glebae]|uniref:DUF2889 domain-containing protein n=1 Tax=Caballeronia glebae TaxID=1777143 RepID=A0A158DQJ3_9BURK|nr:DUF2889 domain-containing protein [Caballeronia glebae]SAK96901.1 hypothetical protein AWB82_07081 [Caballeronia glebae]
MTTDRVPLHTRQITLQGFKRADGLYDIEGRLRDTKSYDRASHGVIVKAGEPVHEMMLRITIGVDFVIREAIAESITVPYVGHCETITPEYRKLAGMKLAPGFMREIRNLFGGTRGCTHLTELIGAVATAAFQTMSEEINASGTTRPFQLNGCHALRTDGPLVKAFHPKWYEAPKRA